MFKFIHTQDEVHEILEPFYKDFYDAIFESFQAYRQVTGFYEFLPVRSRADLIRNGAFPLFKRKFKDNPNVTFFYESDKDLLVLVIGNQIALRFKKLSKNLGANFNTTQQSIDFVKQQLCIPEILTPMSNLVLGYVPNETWTNFKSIYIAHPQGYFAINVSRYIEQNHEQPQHHLEFTSESALPHEPIIRLKNNRKRRAQGDANNKNQS